MREPWATSLPRLNNHKGIIDMKRVRTAVVLSGCAIACMTCGYLFAQAEKPAVRETELASIDLGEHFDALRGRRMRMNRAIIDPGASGSVHSHRGRPEIVHVLKGVLVEHQGDTSREYRAGDTFVSNADMSGPHRIENRSEEPTEVLLVEIPAL